MEERRISSGQTRFEVVVDIVLVRAGGHDNGEELVFRDLSLEIPDEASFTQNRPRGHLFDGSG